MENNNQQQNKCHWTYDPRLDGTRMAATYSVLSFIDKTIVQDICITKKSLRKLKFSPI